MRPLKVGISAEPTVDAKGVALEHCHNWLEWAAAQIDVCLDDDKPACDQLLESLADLLQSTTSAPTSAASACDATSSPHMSAVVIAVQSHDRVMQRLMHVAGAMRGLGEHLEEARCAHSCESWCELRRIQLSKFSMAEERSLFIGIVAPEHAGSHEAADSEDTIELFMAEGNGLP